MANCCPTTRERDIALVGRRAMIGAAVLGAGVGFSAGNSTPRETGSGSGASLTTAGIAELSVTTYEPIPASLHPDAVLLSLCSDFDHLENQVTALVEASTAETPNEEAAMEALIAPYLALQESLLARIVSYRSVSLEGVHARARTFCNWYTDLSFEFGGDQWDHRMLLALLRDLRGFDNATLGR